VECRESGRIRYPTHAARFGKTRRTCPLTCRGRRIRVNASPCPATPGPLRGRRGCIARPAHTAILRRRQAKPTAARPTPNSASEVGAGTLVSGGSDRDTSAVFPVRPTCSWGSLLTRSDSGPAFVTGPRPPNSRQVRGPEKNLLGIQSCAGNILPECEISDSPEVAARPVSLLDARQRRARASPPCDVSGTAATRVANERGHRANRADNNRDGLDATRGGPRPAL